MKPGPVSLILSAVIAVFFVFPTVIVVMTSFTEGSTVTFPPQGFSLHWYEEVLKSPKWLTALGHSATVAVLAAALAVVLGLLLAFAGARGRLLRPGLVTTVAIVPMVIPIVVSALGYFMVGSRLGLTGTTFGFALAHASIALPFVYVNAVAALTSINPAVEEASRVSGASEIGTALRISLPLVLPAAMVGGVLAFVTSWDEVVIALLLSDPGYRTVPVLIFGEVVSGARPSTSAIASLVTAASVLAMFLTAMPMGIRSLRSRRKGRAPQTKPLGGKVDSQ